MLKSFEPIFMKIQVKGNIDKYIRSHKVIFVFINYDANIIKTKDFNKMEYEYKDHFLIGEVSLFFFIL